MYATLVSKLASFSFQKSKAPRISAKWFQDSHSKNGLTKSTKMKVLHQDQVFPTQGQEHITSTF